METVTLRHVSRKSRGIIYFYDGLAVAEDGAVTLPLDNPVHIRAAMRRGYRVTEDGKRLNTYSELLDYVAQSKQQPKERKLHEGSGSRR